MTKYVPYTPKYDKDIHVPSAIELGREGKDICHFCGEHGIHKGTYYQWVEDHTEFEEAHEISRQLAEIYWVARGDAGMESQNFNMGMYKFFMVNKFRWTNDRCLLTDLTKAKDVAGKLKLLEKEVKKGVVTPVELSALGAFIGLTVAINEKTDVAAKVDELMILAKGKQKAVKKKAPKK